MAADSARYPWLRPVGLPEVLRSSSAAADGRSAELSYPDSARNAELPASALPPVNDTLAAVAGFSEALPPGQTTTRPVTETALSALSAAWRGDPAASADRRANADAGLEQLRASVRAVASPEITLTSREGRLPVTLENNLPEAVNVTLRLTSLDRSRVESDTSVNRVIPPGQKVQVEVAVTATSAGTFPVRLDLLTPTGRPIGPSQQVLIRSTAAGVVAIGVTVAALGVLVLAVAIRAVRALLRRRRRARRSADGEAAGRDPRSGAHMSPGSERRDPRETRPEHGPEDGRENEPGGAPDAPPTVEVPQLESPTVQVPATPRRVPAAGRSTARPPQPDPPTPDVPELDDSPTLAVPVLQHLRDEAERRRAAGGTGSVAPEPPAGDDDLTEPQARTESSDEAATEPEPVLLELRSAPAPARTPAPTRRRRRRRAGPAPSGSVERPG